MARYGSTPTPQQQPDSPAAPICARRDCSDTATACIQYVDPVTGPGSLHDVCVDHAVWLTTFDCYVLVGAGR